MAEQKIVVGLSGGVDSSVAIMLLKKQGWEPIGVSLKLPVWKGNGCEKRCQKENVCCTERSIAVAKKVCKRLGVKHFVYDVRKNFEKKVVGYFLAEHKRFRTPNPCIYCNRYIKFSKLFEFAKRNGIKYVATGHYAKISVDKQGNQVLLKPKDLEKDQTYGLCLLSRSLLKKIIFPLADYTKDEVYDLAQDEKINFFQKIKQSQDFCYASGKEIALFLGQSLGARPGKVVDLSGNNLGKCDDLHSYTIGQRKGLAVAGYYVKKIDPKNNCLIVTDNRNLVSVKEITLSKCNFLSSRIGIRKIKVRVITRYRQQLSDAIIQRIGRCRAKVIFKKPVEAVAPGQFCVFYYDNECVGGGVIDNY